MAVVLEKSFDEIGYQARLEPILWDFPRRFYAVQTVQKGNKWNIFQYIYSWPESHQLGMPIGVEHCGIAKDRRAAESLTLELARIAAERLAKRYDQDLAIIDLTKRKSN